MLAQALLEHGADINARDSGSQSTTDYVRERNDNNMMPLLERYGART